MLKEYDVVLANRELSQAVIRGTEGTILLILRKTPNVYLIEFVDENKDTLELLEVNEDDLEIVK